MASRRNASPPGSDPEASGPGSLVASEARFRHYFDNAPDSVFIVDSAGRYDEVNPAACRLLGYRRAELLSKSMVDLLSAEGAAHGLAGFATLKEKGRDSREIELVRKNGERVWVAIDSVSLPDGRFMGFCKDISERRLAEEKRELYFRAMDSINQAVLISDAEGRVVEINRAFVELYGYSREEVLGQNPRVLNPGIDAYRNLGYSKEEYQALFEGMWRDLKNPGKGFWDGVVINRRKDGALVWAQLHVNALRDPSGTIQYLIGLPYDISESRLREKLGRIELYSTLAALAELRDNETGNHMRRVGILAKILAKSLGMPAKYCEDIEIFAPMHDIGKVGILDSILHAPRALSPGEWAEMKKHTILGYNIVKGKRELDMVAAITLRHHERWDGSGYPGGLSGEAIPLSARITALVDVYDALRSERPYKRAWSHEEAAEEIERISGTHLDPKIVECFTRQRLIFEAIHAELV